MVCLFEERGNRFNILGRLENKVDKFSRLFVLLYCRIVFEMRRLIISWLAVLSTVLLIRSVSGYFVVVDANAEECFFDRVTAGTKMSLTFEVAEGGFLDIDVTVCISEFMLW